MAGTGTDPAARGWRFDWLRDWPAIWSAGNLGRWQAALGDAAAHATPFMHPDLVRGWLEASGGESAWQPYFLTATHADGQIVLWLLVRARSDWESGLLRLLEPVGGTLFDYHDPIVVPAAPGDSVLAPGFWRALEAELRRHEGDWFDHCAFSRLRPACFGDGDFDRESGKGALVRLDPYPDFAAYMAARRGSINKLARKQRKLAASGESGLRVAAPDEVDLALSWLPALDAAYRARYPGGAVTADFLGAIVRHGLPAGVVHCSALELDGQAFSWHFGFTLGRTYYDYICGFDADYGRLSPGLMHVHELIRWLYEATEIRTYDFLLGAEGYKADWTDGEEVTVRSAALRSGAVATLGRRTARRGLSLARRLAPGLAARTLPPAGDPRSL